jgi:hypothetical protein
MEVKRVIDSFFTPVVHGHGEEGITIPTKEEPAVVIKDPVVITVKENEEIPPVPDVIKKEEAIEDPPEPVIEPLKDEDDPSLKELEPPQLYALLAKEEGLLPEDFDEMKVKETPELFKAIQSATEVKLKKQYEEEFSEINIDLYAAFLKGDLDNTECHKVARDVQTLSYISNLEVDEDTTEARQNRLQVLQYYYQYIKGLNPTAVKATIETHIKDNSDVQMASEAQESFNQMAIEKKNNYFKTLKDKEDQTIKDLNLVIENSKLEDIHLKTENQRKKLKSIFNDKTEETIVNENGRKYVRSETRADKILREAFNDPKKIITIISILEKMSTFDDVVESKSKSRKDQIYSYLKKEKEEQQPPDNKPSQYWLLDRLKEENVSR